MCIFNEDVDSVNKTKIFVAPDNTNTRQIVVYENAIINRSNNNAMILPVPYPATIRLHNLSNYPTIFKDLASAFPNLTNSSNGYQAESLDRDDYVDVVDLGSYKVSICMNLLDLLKLNPNTFIKVTNGVLRTFEQFYSKGFGFIVCKLKTDIEEVKYHPFAYSHRCLDGGYYFVPTRHQHGNVPEKTSDYDHDIYSINTNSLCGIGSMFKLSSINSQSLDNFPIANTNVIRRLRINGKKLNTDLYFNSKEPNWNSGQIIGADGCRFEFNPNYVRFEIQPDSFYLKPLVDGFSLQRQEGLPIVLAGNYIRIIVDKDIVILDDKIDINEETRYIFRRHPVTTNHAMYGRGRAYLLA